MIENRKTKIICTIGPASESKEMMTKLVENGMNIIRLNFSHGDYKEHGIKVGETIIIVAGYPVGNGATNTMKIIEVK